MTIGRSLTKSPVSDPGVDLETLLVGGQEPATGESPSHHIANEGFIDYTKLIFFVKDTKDRV